MDDRPTDDDATRGGTMATNSADLIEALNDLESDVVDAAASGVVEIRPAEALERLRRGEPIQDARITGLRFKGAFPLPVRMKQVELVNPSFAGAEFADEVVIERSTLVRPTCRSFARFAKNFDLRGSKVIRGMFHNLDVAGTWRCDNLRAVGNFVATHSKFAGVRFWNARFGGWVDLKDCTFSGEADFRSFHAEEGMNLTDCRFEGDALFRGATSCKKWDAGNSHFAGMLDLSKVKFQDFAYLEAIQTGPDHAIAFHNAVAERVLVRPDQIEGRLASERAGQHEQAMHEYGLLKRIFEGLHRYEAEDWAFYRFKVNQRRCRPRSWRKPWTKLAEACDWLFLDQGCGYGTNPFRAVRMAAILVLSFALIYMLDVAKLPVEKPPFAGPITGIMNRIMIGLLTSVSVFTSGFGSLKDAAQGWMNLPLLAESLLGTLLWGLFIVAFSRKVIR